MTGSRDPGKLARFLRQMKEFGEDRIILDGMDSRAVREALRSASRGTVPAESTTAEGTRSVRLPALERPPSTTAESSGSVPSSTDGVPSESEELSDGQIAELDYDRLKEVALSCTRCGLAEERTRVVFSDGNPKARLMVVGEAPGANEDRTGLPFVGRAGKLLDLMLAAVDLSRKDSVYICNVLKCRPPGNRNPTADEIELCAPYLKRQIALVEPGAILAVGTFAAQLLTGRNRSLGKLRGEVFSYEGVPLVVTYHPAALLRNPNWTRPAWDDLQLLRQIID